MDATERIEREKEQLDAYGKMYTALGELSIALLATDPEARARALRNYRGLMSAIGSKIMAQYALLKAQKGGAEDGR